MLKSQLWKDFQKLNIRLPVSNCQPPPSLGTPSVWPPEDLCLLSHHQPVSQRVCLLFCHHQPGHLRSPVTSTKVALLGLSSIYGFLRGPIPFADASLQPNHWRSFSSTPVGHLCGSQNTSSVGLLADPSSCSTLVMDYLAITWTLFLPWFCIRLLPVFHFVFWFQFWSFDFLHWFQQCCQVSPPPRVVSSSLWCPSSRLFVFPPCGSLVLTCICLGLFVTLWIISIKTTFLSFTPGFLSSACMLTTQPFPDSVLLRGSGFVENRSTLFYDDSWNKTFHIVFTSF